MSRTAPEGKPAESAKTPPAPSWAWLKFLGLLLTLGAIAWLGHRSGLDSSHLRPERIRDWIRAAGPLGPLAYIVVYTFGAMLLVPGILLSLAAGLAFGWKLGFLVVVLGSNCAANAAFGLVRLLGRDLARRLLRGPLARFDRQSARHGFRIVLLLRLIPLVPFEALNYGAGLSGIRWRDYALATFLGMLPGTFAYVYLGGNLNPRDWRFWLAVALLLVLATVAIAYRRHGEEDSAVTLESAPAVKEPSGS